MTLKEKKIVRKIGESKIITIPPKMCKSLGIDVNTVLDIEQIDNKIVMTPMLEVVKK